MIRIALFLAMSACNVAACAGPLAALAGKGGPAPSALRTATSTGATPAPVLRASLTEAETIAADGHHLVQAPVVLVRRQCDKPQMVNDSGQASNPCRSSGHDAAAARK